MTDVGVVGGCVHDAPSLLTCCKQEVVEIHWLSSQFQSELLHQTTDQYEVQILEKWQFFINRMPSIIAGSDPGLQYLHGGVLSWKCTHIRKTPNPPPTTYLLFKKEKVITYWISTKLQKWHKVHPVHPLESKGGKHFVCYLRSRGMKSTHGGVHPLQLSPESTPE